MNNLRKPVDVKQLNLSPKQIEPIPEAEPDFEIFKLHTEQLLPNATCSNMHAWPDQWPQHT